MSRFWGIFFIDTSSADMAEQEFSKMARTCRVGESMEDFKRCLTNSVEPWLLILDNADDPSLDIGRFFPVGNRGTIIVTSRNPDCKCHATVGSRELREMEDDEAITLLLRSGDLLSDDEDLRCLALPIVKTLDCLALAVNHAGASIRQRICSLEDYVQIYTRHRKKLLSSRPIQAGSDYKYAVYTTWEISVDSIKELAKDTTDNTAANALELLTLFGFCHFDDITEHTFKSAWGNFSRTENCPWWASNLLGMIRDGRLSSWDSLGFNKAIQLLSSYSLIHISGPRTRISLHPLVHSWIRDSLNEEEHLRWWNVTVSTLALASNTDSYYLERQLRDHLRHCIGTRQVDDLFAEDDVPLDRVQISLSIILVYRIHQGKDGLMLAERALQYSRKLLGDECYSTCKLSYQLAIIVFAMHDYEKASDLLHRIVDLCIRVLGPTHYLALNSMVLLGRAYGILGRKQEALELAQKTLTVCEKSPDESDAASIEAVGTIAMVYDELGRNEEAVDLLEKVLAMRKEALGEEDEAILSTEYLLPLAYSHSGQHQVALEMFQTTLKKMLKAVGEDHSLTLETMICIACEYGSLGQSEKGIPLVVKALEVGSRIGADSYLERWKKLLGQLQYQSANISTIVAKSLSES